MGRSGTWVALQGLSSFQAKGQDFYTLTTDQSLCAGCAREGPQLWARWHLWLILIFTGRITESHQLPTLPAAQSVHASVLKGEMSHTAVSTTAANAHPFHQAQEGCLICKKPFPPNLILKLLTDKLCLRIRSPGPRFFPYCFVHNKHS